MGGQRQSPLIFLVDDDPQVLRTLKRTLRALPCQIRTFSSAEEALAHIAEAPPALVVSDYSMPGMNGAALLAEVRSRFPKVRTMLLTGTRPTALDPENVIDRIMEKPWEEAALLQTIRQLLGEE